MKEINAADALAKVKNEEAIMVDVREDYEVEELSYDVPNLLHIPLGDLPTRKDELPKDKALIMACRSGVRSGNATQFLSNEGFEVENLKGGIMNWQNNDMPTKS